MKNKSSVSFLQKGGNTFKRLDIAALKADPEYKKYNLYINEDNLNVIQDSLINRNAGYAQRVAALASIIAENGGRTTPHGNGAHGLIGWRGSRAIDLPTDLPNQTSKLMVEIFSNPSGRAWTHGGQGTNVRSGKEMYELFNNTQNVEQATKAMTKGYIRPEKEEWPTRMGLANLIKKYMK